MPPQRARSPARLLAPAALVVFALAVVLIVLSSAGGDDATTKRADTDTDAATDQETTTTGRAPAGRRRPAATYTVKRGDTLGSIAERTAVEVERLQELNPQLDAQALIAGQKIKLRE